MRVKHVDLLEAGDNKPEFAVEISVAEQVGLVRPVYYPVSAIMLNTESSFFLSQ